MPIIKKGSADNFMMMQRHPLQRSDMTMRAKGLLAYLMSLPHDWVIHRTELVSHFKDGKDAVFAALNELIDLGYVVRQQGRGTKGKFAEVNYTASDVLLSLPQTDLPVADKPVTDLPVTVNPHLQRNTIQSNSNTKKEVYKETEGQRPEQRIDNSSNSVPNGQELPQLPMAYARAVIEQAISDNGFDYATGPYQLKQKQSLLYYISDDGMEPELVAKSIQLTKERGGKSFTYTDRILSDWRAQHILTIKQLETFEAQKQGVANKYGDKQKKEIW
ncbi:DnaD domain protein [Weissella confusa]|uniref:DnaD domain protein n=1 Tax=Weissella confusa TaxID=1583 RepID=UPI0021C0EBF3|nr:DnaD domain protein [Weissella confusa]MCT8393177.1 DnaD domain protein [Weissella confusa]